ncbi:DUF2938 family protein [Gayadomonas joobiniege]|uniref:DUF2938 family protein n=1 Tax=Gayadomonas joobiniege TaxID=1234606 RepID=UPI000361E03F|nr:DUF2938 family protein [Gayadomonas joobiniege]
MDNGWKILLIGVSATIFMDIVLWLKYKIFAVAPPNWGMVGRWVGHMFKGQFTHAFIGDSTALKYESVLGWFTHYLTGLVYAVLLVICTGSDWLTAPSVWPALLFGVITLIAPFFIMQPCLGLGIAASQSKQPNLMRLHSLFNHSIFGLGLYLGAYLLVQVGR